MGWALVPIMERMRGQLPGRTANQQHSIVSEDGSAGRDWAAGRWLGINGTQRHLWPVGAAGHLSGWTGQGKARLGHSAGPVGGACTCTWPLAQGPHSARF